MPGFVSPNNVEDDDDNNITSQLQSLTFQSLNSLITRGIYIMEESELPDAYKELLHGRPFIIDRLTITSTSSSPTIFYISADKVQGLIVPSRSLFIKSEISDAYYRTTDDGDKWTDWITLTEGTGHTYFKDELCRFAEVQVYTADPEALITLRATR